MNSSIFTITYKLRSSPYIELLEPMLEKEAGRRIYHNIFNLDSEGGIASSFLIIMNELTEHAFMALNEVSIGSARIDLVLSLPSLINSIKSIQTIIYERGNNSLEKIASRGLIVIEVKRFNVLYHGLKYKRVFGDIVRQIRDRILELGDISTVFLLSACYNERYNCCEYKRMIIRQYMEAIGKEIELIMKTEKDKDYLCGAKYGVILITTDKINLLSNESVNLTISYNRVYSKQCNYIPREQSFTQQVLLSKLSNLANYINSSFIYVKELNAKYVGSPVYLVRSGKSQRIIPSYLLVKGGNPLNA